MVPFARPRLIFGLALGTEPRDVLDYLITRGGAGIPRWVAAADVADALVLTTWCWWEDRRRERQLLRKGLHLGLSLAELGAPLGMRTPQGTRDRLDRLDALLKFDRPDEQLTRTARREHSEHDARQDWIDQHRAEIRAILAAVLAQAARVGRSSLTDAETPSTDPQIEADRAEPDWLDELAADYNSDQLTPATLALAGLAAAEMRTRPTILNLDPKHRLHAVLRYLDTLRTRFAGEV